MVLLSRPVPRDWRQRSFMPHKKSSILLHEVQSGVVTIFSSHGYDPLKFWSVDAGQGTVCRRRTPDVEGLVLNLTTPTAFCSTSITAPEDVRLRMGCRMNMVTLMVEYLNLPFGFELQVRDSKNHKRRFRISSCQVTSKLSPLFCHLPLRMDDGWNKIEVNLQSLTKLAYGTDYVELLSLQIYANCRLRRVYLTNLKVEEEDLPEDFILKEPRPLHRIKKHAHR